MTAVTPEISKTLPKERADAPEVRQNRTREQILHAAHRCLIAVGFENITTRRIAEAAGVNIATLHYHFGSKEALLTAVVAYASSRSEQSLREAAGAAPDAPAALRAGIRRAWELVREQPGKLRYDLVVRGFRDETACRNAIAIYETYDRLTTEIFVRHLAAGGTLPEGLTAAQMATYVNSNIDGAVIRFALTHDEEAAQLSFTLILKNALQMMGIEDGSTTNEYTGF